MSGGGWGMWRGRERCTATVRDTSGNAMATEYVWRFDTERHSAFLPVVVKWGDTGSRCWSWRKPRGCFAAELGRTGAYSRGWSCADQVWERGEWESGQGKAALAKAQRRKGGAGVVGGSAGEHRREQPVLELCRQFRGAVGGERGVAPAGGTGSSGAVRIAASEFAAGEEMSYNVKSCRMERVPARDIISAFRRACRRHMRVHSMSRR